MNLKRTLIVGILSLFVLNFIFSNYVYVRFEMKNVSEKNLEFVIKELNIDYIDPKYVNEGYLEKDKNSYNITVVGWDSIKLIKKGYKISDIQLGSLF